VAVESVVKIVIFVTAGLFVCYGVFDGMGDIYGRILSHPEWRSLATLTDSPGDGYSRWLAYMVIAVFDVILLPRQFHILVVQNGDEKHIKTAMWMFPCTFSRSTCSSCRSPSGLLLGLPASAGTSTSCPSRCYRRKLSLAVFWGFSAATAM
jgi:hypothetical protein